MLQIFLSKKESKWLGLILPTISFLYSLIAVVGFIAYTFVGNQNEEVAGSLFPIMALLIYPNIPTVILLLIYSHYREEKRKHKEIDKMNIQDLN